MSVSWSQVKTEHFSKMKEAGGGGGGTFNITYQGYATFFKVKFCAEPGFSDENLSKIQIFGVEFGAGSRFQGHF